MARGPARRRARKILLLTNNLPPVRGGSGVVYDNLARQADGRIIVLAPRRNYQDGLALIGWREHDRLAPYRVIRLDLLRTVLEGRVLEGRVLEGGVLEGGVLEGGVPEGGRLRLWRDDAAIRLRLLATLLRCLLAERVGAVCVGELVASAWVLGVLRLLPWVTRAVYVHGEEITTRDEYDRRLARRRRALLAAHHIIVVSRFTAGAVESLLGAAARPRIRLIENGVDGVRFRPLPRPAALAARLGLAENFVFVSVCRLLEKKGIDQAIRAFARVLAAFPDSRYLIVGDGPYRAALEALAVAEGIASAVRFVGAVAEDELTDHYALGDVFVMPNRRLANGDTEGFGLVFLEANACGLPVIAGLDGGSVDAVQDGVNGLLVDGHSVAAITAAMRALRGDAALRARLRAGGLAAAAAAGWGDKTTQFLALFAPA